MASHDELLQKYISACQTGDFNTVKDLIENNLVGVNDHLDDKVTGLHWAAINNRLSICDYLISKSAIVDAPAGELNATPLHWACRYGLVYIVDFLIQHGANPELCDDQGLNGLQLAIQSSNIMLVIYMVLMTNVDVNGTDPNNRTPLHWAAYQGDGLSTDVLLKFGANVNGVDNTGFTPLHWALIKANPLCLEKLIKSDTNTGGVCEIFATTNDGKTAFDIAIDMNNTETFQEALKLCGKDTFGNDISVPKLFADNPKLPKVVTFLYPYILIGLTLEFFSDYYEFWQTLLFNIGTYFMAYYTLKKFIFPSYTHEKNKLVKSPLLAGVFSSTAVWVIINWIVYILPITITRHLIANIAFSIFASILIFLFFKVMFLNPGKITPLPIKQNSNMNDLEKIDDDETLVDNDEKIRSEVVAGIRQLIKTGKFDSKNFCIYSFVRRPLRSKYSFFSNALIARFDHFCPWVYNDIGYRNHKLFIFFVLTLNTAIGIFSYLSLQYFNYYSTFTSQIVYANNDHKVKTVKRPPHTPFQVYDPIPKNRCTILASSWCNGYSDSFPLFVLNCFCLFQGLWITFLIFVQFYQISKNLTSNEASKIKKHGQETNYYYSPVPIELLTELESPINNYSNNSTSIDNHILGSNDDEETNSEINKDAKITGNEPEDIFKWRNPLHLCSPCLKVIGITQFFDTFKNKKRYNSGHFNFGMKSNCLEFWCLGNTSSSKSKLSNIRNFFRIPAEKNGETYVADQLIDYYKLYDYPIKRVSHKELV